MRRPTLFIVTILFGCATQAFAATNYIADTVNASIALKVPGNDSKTFKINFSANGNGAMTSQATITVPVEITRRITNIDGRKRISVTLHATKDVYFNYSEHVSTGYKHSDCLFLMPGFWYRRNLRSPKEAPSFHTSDSWTVREDRLSTPLTAVFDSVSGRSVSVIRIDNFGKEALTTHHEGEVIVSGETSIGYTGFENINGTSTLSYGFPYRETPKTYIRKLTLASSITAFQLLRSGTSLTLTWEIAERKAKDFAECVRRTWEYCFDTCQPKPVDTTYDAARMKSELSRFFTQSYMGNNDLHYFSGVEMLTSTCVSTGLAEVGFVGRTLLNAFNALEYAEEKNMPEIAAMARSVFDSYLSHGFSPEGFIREVVRFDNHPANNVRSIRRQSEGVYAALYYLDYERRHGRKHTEWEKKIKTILDLFMKMQKEDGSFPRKFNDDFTIVDNSGGSTPSATLPLVMAYKYFKDKRYLKSAVRTVDYLEKEIISKSDYFSSTLDANCEDKEASLYASTATYYLALATKGKEQERYAALARKASYFALSWYYTWDVPFAQGQMLGDMGLKTRGWGNVSTENNHIDVFIFDFVDVLHWLSKRYNEPRFSGFADVIGTSMRQLLPYEGHLCGVAKPGYYPEVVQHTNWDYGRNGKGFYNNIFAPGWTVASLWELLSSGRAERFFGGK